MQFLSVLGQHSALAFASYFYTCKRHLYFWLPSDEASFPQHAHSFIFFVTLPEADEMPVLHTGILWL